VRAADLATGAKGKLEWKVEYTDSKADAALRSLRTGGKVGLAIGPSREVQTAEIEADLSATGPALPPDQLKLNASVGRTSAGNEDYVATLSLLRGGKVERLLTAKARYDATARDINGDWEIALRSEQLAALLAGFGLPEIAASGSGKFGVKPAAGAASASGTLEAGVTGLGKLSPALAAVGAVRVKSAFDGAVADNAAEIGLRDVINDDQLFREMRDRFGSPFGFGEYFEGGMGAAAIGVGLIFGNFLSGALRNPSAADGQFGRAFIGAALAEGLGIFAFLVAIILLFVK